MGIKPQLVGIVLNISHALVTEWKLRNGKTKEKRNPVTFTLLLLRTSCIAVLCLRSVITHICK